MVAAGAVLPKPVADEIVHQYADVLRVGRVTLNGSAITWDTSAASSQQLQCFCQEFVRGLGQVPALESWDDRILCQVAHWFCKVVSINYVLAEVLELLRQRLGAVCAIKTTGDRGESLLDYSAEVRDDCTMRVCLGFRGKGNIISCKPGSAKKQVRGTLSWLEAEFPLPPEVGFAPTYHLQMVLRGSRASRLVERVARTCATAQAGPRQKVPLLAPLRTGDFEACATPGGLTALSTLSTMSPRASDSTGSSPSEIDEDDALFTVPLSFTAHSVKWGPSRDSGAGQLPGLIHL